MILRTLTVALAMLVISACSHAPTGPAPAAATSAASAFANACLACMHFIKAKDYLKREERVPAMAELNQAIALDAQAEYYAVRGHVHAELAQPEAAIADLDQALRLQPEHPEARFDRAFLSYAQGDLKRAQADIIRAVQLSPRNPRFLGGRCVIDIASGRDAKNALTYCERALEYPRPANAYTARGEAYLLLRRDHEALADFGAALVAQPTHMRALYGRGLARTRLGEHESGQKDMATALQHLPGAAREFIPGT